MLVAANRDEHLDRASAGPRRTDHDDGWIVAPVDLVAGGTWLGLNRHGVFVGITNRRHAPHDPARESRGHLVTMALREATAADAASVIAERDGSRTNGFHLFCADARGVWRVIGDGERMTLDALGTGVHVATERSFSGTPPQRESELVARLQTGDGDRRDLDGLGRLLGTHGDEPMEGTCVHIDDRRYGTRSSTLVAIGTATTPWRLLHADGPPCRTPYEDLSHLVARG